MLSFAPALNHSGMHALKKPEKQDRVGAVGTPGIGKTTSTSILIRMLLKKGRTAYIWYEQKEKHGWKYEFLPKWVVPQASI
jgi:ABC-type microcin C transport system duplicated ATPase subunit YejF